MSKDLPGSGLKKRILVDEINGDLVLDQELDGLQEKISRSTGPENIYIVDVSVSGFHFQCYRRVDISNLREFVFNDVPIEVIGPEIELLRGDDNAGSDFTHYL